METEPDQDSIRYSRRECGRAHTVFPSWSDLRVMDDVSLPLQKTRKGRMAEPYHLQAATSRFCIFILINKPFSGRGCDGNVLGYGASRHIRR